VFVLLVNRTQKVMGVFSVNSGNRYRLIDSRRVDQILN